MSVSGERLKKRDDFENINKKLFEISESIKKRVEKGQAEHQIAGVKIAKTPEIRVSFQKNMGQAKASAENLRVCLDKGTPEALNRWK